MKKQRYFIIFSVIILILILGFIFIKNQNKPVTPVKNIPVQAEKKEKQTVKLNNKATISIKNPDHQKLMNERKKEYGVDESLDMVVKSDEKIRINDQVIDMKKIEEQDMINRGQPISSDLKSNKSNITLKDYGLYVVKKGDNLWDIHFRLLKELFRKKGITLSRTADEPINGGYSSGVGKILKFSEEMVSIYSLENQKVSSDINNIEPNGKVIIYKMNDIQDLIKDMTVRNIDNVVFDGKNLWIESSSSQDN